MRLRVFLGAFLLGAATLPAQTFEAPAPRLAVLISLDQCRADYLERFQPYFSGGGFNRLLNGGAVFTECHHRHATTNTSNGHATLVTGVHAEIHGIIYNEWLTRDTLEQVGAVSDLDYPLVGLPPPAVRIVKDVTEGKFGASPRRLLASTIGDQLKLRHGANCRVVSIGGKNRSTILMGGRLADAAYWMERGRFVTSRFYRESLPAWVEDFDRTENADRDFQREWVRLLPASTYDEVQGPDNAKGEENAHGLGVVFPHRIDAGKPAISDAFYDAQRLTPYGTQMIVSFAKRAVLEERLGHHPAPDLLCLGISQLDYCGHSYGPDSHEIMDSVIRLDRALAEFFAFLDAEIGRNAYTVVLSSDHGVAPLPDRVRSSDRGLVSARFDAKSLNQAVEAALTQAYGAPPEGAYWAVRDVTGYRLRRETLAAKQVSLADAEAVAKAALLHSPQIAAAFTGAELATIAPEGDSLAASVRRGYNLERSPDIVFVVAPYVVDRSNGSNHGTPYDYDNHVPLLWYGARVPRGWHTARVGTDQLVPSLAAVLGVPKPPQVRGECLF